MNVGIALSGGGTRGMVHVGVLQALEENNIFPQIISGTSAGSIVGALYAHGYKPLEILDMSRQNSLLRMLNLRLPNKGFVKQKFLQRQLKNFLPHNSFEQLEKPLYIAIANLNTGAVEYKNSGELHDIILASSAVPIIFEPIEINGHLFVDGGIVKNMPVSILKDKADFIIAVNLVPQLHVQNETIKNMMGVATRCFNLAVLNNIMPELALADVVIEPAKIESFSRYRFNNLKEMYDIGYEEAMNHMDEIKMSLEAMTH